MATFTWYSQSAQKSAEPRVLAAAFGDGYQQRVGDGINALAASWELTFSSVAADIDAIEAFIEARAGVESFDWTDPDGNAIQAVCPAWSRSPHTGLRSAVMTATFRQVFGE
jgi:phage-related protein